MDSSISSSITNPIKDQERYSRLLALERLGIVQDYQQIRHKSVAVVGVGGVGSVAAEMLVRCGVGKLHFFDYDTVELANMNRLFYRPKHIGLKKTEAAAKILGAIDPSVALCPHAIDVSRVEAYAEVVEILATGGWEAGKPVDLILGCVDNYQARLCIDRMALALDISWIESGVAENGISGHIQLVIPGQTACFHCAPPLVVASGIDEATLKRDGVCAASLPTTMAIVSGLLVQNALKFLLQFGQLTFYQGYGGLQDHFPNYIMKPNPECTNRYCIERQRTASPHHLFFDRQTLPHDQSVDETHLTNEWGIEMIKENDDDSSASPALHLMNNQIIHAIIPQDQSLDDLKNVLKSL